MQGSGSSLRTTHHKDQSPEITFMVVFVGHDLFLLYKRLIFFPFSYFFLECTHHSGMKGWDVTASFDLIYNLWLYVVALPS